MLKHSVKSVVRSPGKSFWFILLLSAAIMFVSLGSSMLYSANRMLDQADEQFNTVVALKYGDLHEGEGAWDDAAFQENMAQLDFDQLAEHPAVQTVDLERDIFAFTEDGMDIVQRSSPLRDINIFTFIPLFQDETGVWQVLSQKSYFGSVVGEQILVKLNPYDSDGNYIADQIEMDKVYLASAHVGYVHTSRYATFVKPADLTNQDRNELLSLSGFTDVTNYTELAPSTGVYIIPEYMETPEGQLWTTLMDSMTVINQSFSVVTSSYLPAAVPFHLNQTWLLDGEFESDETYQTQDKNICYISDRVAALLDLQVGDTWPLKFHYSPAGSPAHSYWEENGFDYEADIRVAGIFNEVHGLAFMVYMPLPDWVEKTPDNYNLLRVLVDNREVGAYVDYLDGVLPENIGIQIEDQGYAAAVKPILTLREHAITLTSISGVAGIAVVVLFSYLFISRQRETAQVMMMMGTGRRRTAAYLLYGILLVALLSSVLGIVLSGLFDAQVTETVWQSLQSEPVLDLRYSERALGIPVEFNPELATAAWVRWMSAGVLVFIIIMITTFFAVATLRKPKRKKIKKVTVEPVFKGGKGITFARVPSVSLRFALRSIRRNFLRSLIVPVAALLLAAFIALLGLAAQQQYDQAEAVYDEVPTPAYITTFLGVGKEIPLHLQGDIFRMLEPTYQSRSTWEMVRTPMSGEELLGLRESYEENSPLVENFLLTAKMHYVAMGVVEDAEGNLVNPDLPRRPDVVRHSNGYGFDWFEAVVKQMPTMLFTDSLSVLPEFSSTNSQDIAWLEGYSDDALRSPEYIMVIPDRLAEQEGVQIGDTMRVAVYVSFQNQGILMEAYDFLVAGTYHQGSRSPVIYAPWSLVTTMPITSDQNYLALETIYDDVPEEWLASNEYLADSVNSAIMIPQEPRNLAGLRDYLEEHDYSQVGQINRNRLAVVIEDKALADAIESIQQHISFMNLVTPIMLVLSGIIGFVLSYLLTRNRLREFAIMRSMGTKRIQVYSAFFLEQFMLYILGITPVLVAMWVQPGWAAIFGGNILWFILSYSLGIMIAIGLMGRAKVLDILFSKE
ncbi:ABC transporter permease [bacterium]|nr:ABC transporter permease [bacterium]